MFSTLGQILSRPFRQAESADARMNIRRQDPDQNRKQPDDKDKPAYLVEEDRATVSVEALHAFFVNFLETLEQTESTSPTPPNESAQQPPTTTEEGASTTPTTPQTTTAPNKAAHAASAYQSAASRNETAAPDLSAAATAEAAESLGLTAEEKRTINLLIADLEDLQKRGIETIIITATDVTFLQAISLAVADAKFAADMV